MQTWQPAQMNNNKLVLSIKFNAKNLDKSMSLVRTNTIGPRLRLSIKNYYWRT